MEIFRTVNFLW